MGNKAWILQEDDGMTSRPPSVERRITMRAFLNQPEVKEKYLARVNAHVRADELIHGTYWKKGKGCAVGCTVETSNEPHLRYEVELGIPSWLAYLEDSMFENMSNGEAQTWPTRFLQAIPVGADLEPIRPTLHRTELPPAPRCLGPAIQTRR